MQLHPGFATDGYPRGFVCSECHPLYYIDASKHPLKIWKTWLMDLVHPLILYNLCYVLFRKEILNIIHAKPLLLVSFTEYPSSPSPYIYVGDEQEGGDA